ncbi:MAG: 30S ribosomal protein S11 [Candidatus Paceibacterota bacterium]
MGKKRIAQKSGEAKGKKAASGGGVQAPRKKLDTGRLHVEATYNNTKVHLSDMKGNVVCWSSSGSLGFNGARKGTPYAAAKVGETIGEMARQMGVKEVSVTITGVGSGRESAVRGFVSKGINLLAIEDRTPVPHNGPRAPKARRV